MAAVPMADSQEQCGNDDGFMGSDVTANAENNDYEVLEPRARKKVFFFDYPDVFEDFYSAYGVTQRTFVERWVGTGNHAFVSLI